MSISKKTPAFFYSVAALSILLYFILLLNNNHSWGGWLLALFFFSLAIAFRGNPFLKGFTFTVIILGVVSLAMYYPHYFKSLGDFKSRHCVSANCCTFNVTLYKINCIILYVFFLMSFFILRFPQGCCKLAISANSLASLEVRRSNILKNFTYIL